MSFQKKRQVNGRCKYKKDVSIFPNLDILSMKTNKEYPAYIEDDDLDEDDEDFEE